jgi:hypothetical protein
VFRECHNTLVDSFLLLADKSLTIINKAIPIPPMLAIRPSISVWLRIGIKRPIPASPRITLFIGLSTLNKYPVKAPLSTKHPERAVAVATTISPQEPMKSKAGKKTKRKGMI